MTTLSPFPPLRPWRRAWLLWLLTNALGTAACIPVARLYLYSPNKPVLEGLEFLTAFFIGGCAALGSLPIVPLAAWAMPHLLCTAGRNQRLSIVALVVSGFFGLATLLLFAASVEATSMALLHGAWVYWPVALVAVIVVYRRWLFSSFISAETTALRAS